MFATGNHLGVGILLRKSKLANTARTRLLFGECLQLSNPRLTSLHNTQASQLPLCCSYWNVWGLSHHVLDGAAYLCRCPDESLFSLGPPVPALAERALWGLRVEGRAITCSTVILAFNFSENQAGIGKLWSLALQFGV